MKRISAILLAFLIILSVSMPITVYADDGWEDINKDTFISAMKAYAKANYNINTTFAYVGYDDPITKAIVSFSYGQFNRISKTLGYNLDDIQASIKARVDSNGALQFLYSGSYVQYYNALIRQYMIDNNINPNDTSFNQEIYNGSIFVDDDGNQCYIYKTSTNLTNVNETTFNNTVSAKGNTFLYDGSVMFSTMLTNSVAVRHINLNQNEFTFNFTKNLSSINERPDYVVLTSGSNPPVLVSNNYCIYFNRTDWQFVEGYATIILNTTNNLLYLGAYSKVNYDNRPNYNLTPVVQLTNYSKNLHNALVNIARDGMPQYPTSEDGKNAIIEAGKLGGDVAQQALKYLEDQEDKDVKQDPDYQGGTPNYPNPDDPVMDNNTGLSLGGQPFHFEMPDLSGFNWEISGLQEKFPFSIPFDMIDFFQVLDANPETPEFRVNVTIANVHVDENISLQAFDSYMPMFRNIILAGWCIFLIIATRSVFKVY